MSETTYPEAGFANRTLADIAATLPGRPVCFAATSSISAVVGGCRWPRPPRTGDWSCTGWKPNSPPSSRSVCRPSTRKRTEDLITLIETRYHATHRRELPELVRLARRVEAVHKANPGGPARHCRTAGTDERRAGRPHVKEEEVLFPLMRRGGHPMIGQPIAAMLAEHDDHGAHLRTLERLTNDFTAPADACPTWRALNIGTKKLTDDLMEHIHTENNVLFPRFLEARPLAQ